MPAWSSVGWPPASSPRLICCWIDRVRFAREVEGLERRVRRAGERGYEYICPHIVSAPRSWDPETPLAGRHATCLGHTVLLAGRRHYLVEAALEGLDAGCV